MSNLPRKKYVSERCDLSQHIANKHHPGTSEELDNIGSKSSFVIPFEKTLLRCYIDSNSIEAALGNTSKEPQDAVIDQECPKCQYPKMSFRTAQLRGLDEGQTIFYSCLNKECGHQYTLNS